MDPNKPLSRRGVLIGGALGAAAIGLAACGNALSSLTPQPSSGPPSAGSGTPQPSSPVVPSPSVGGGTLRFWTPPNATTGTQEFRDAEFAKYTALTGTAIETRVVPWGSLLETYTTGYAGSQPPDVVYIVPGLMGRFANAGSFLDMSAVPNGAKWQALFPADVWGAAAFHGKQWGVTPVTSSPGFIWNKDLFKAAGLDSENPPKTWDDVRAYAKKLAKPDGSVWGFGISDPLDDAANFLANAIYNYGGSMTNADDSQWVANSPEAVAGMEAMRVLYVDDKTAPPKGTFADMWSAFFAGKVAMMQATPGFVTKLAEQHPEFPLGIGPHPFGPANNQAGGGTGVYAIAAKSDVASASSLVDWLVQPDQVGEFAKFGGLVPGRKDVNPFAPGSVADRFVKANTPQLRGPILAVDYWQTFADSFDAAFSGKKTSQQAADDAAKTINAAIAAAKP